MKRFCTIFVILAVGLAAFAGCTRDNGTTPAATTTTTTQAGQQPVVTAPETGPAPFSYPMEGNRQVSWWEALEGSVAANFVNLGDTPFGIALQEQTGITIEFLHPPAGQAGEQFNLMVAVRDFPDVMTTNWFTQFPGGPERAIEEGVIHRLNDIVHNYAPNFVEFFHNERPDIGRQIRTDLGSYFAFPFVRGDIDLQVSQGPYFRADWLAELNLPVPETVEDWEITLTAFRDHFGADAPWGYALGTFRSVDPIALAHGIRLGWYIGHEGEVRYGFVEPAYRDYLEVMRRWWENGLIDPDWATSNQDQINAMFTGGNMGASFGQPGSRMGVKLTAMADHPTFDIVPAPYPVLNRGDRPMHGHFDQAFPGAHSAAITTNARDIEAAARLLDFGFSPEGRIFYNFGVEGVSFNWEDNQPVYTDFMLRNPYGMPLAQAFSHHVRGHYNGIFIQDIRYLMQFWQYQQQRDALPLWTATDAAYHTLPTLAFTPEEAAVVARLQSDITTFVNERHLRFIFGHDDLSTFDDYVAQVYRMGLQELIDVQEAALARWRAR